MCLKGCRKDAECTQAPWWVQSDRNFHRTAYAIDMGWETCQDLYILNPPLLSATVINLPDGFPSILFFLCSAHCKGVFKDKLLKPFRIS